jgi:orotate phosphoribosyltransferase
MDVLALLQDRGAVYLDEHFVYKSKKHGSKYINMDPLFPDVTSMEILCEGLAKPFLGHVDTVAAAATGGIPLAMFTAMNLVGSSGDFAYPQAVWADKKGDDFEFGRAGFAEALRGKRVLVVEDLLNTGDSVKKVIAQARLHGAEIIGVSVICNRGRETAESLGVPRLDALSSVDFQVFDADACPLCANDTRIVEDIGHGDEYKIKNPDYKGGYKKLLG